MTGMADIIDAFISYLKTQSGVSGLIGNGDVPLTLRLYPAGTQRDPAAPFVVYRRISARREHDLDGSRGSARSRFQFDVMANTYTETNSVAKALRLALDGNVGVTDGINFLSTTLENEFDRFE